MSSNEINVDFNIMDKIGFIGLGQCGTNIVKLMHDQKFISYFINTSKSDQKPIEKLPSTIKFSFPNIDGFGHNRDEINKFLQTDETFNKAVISIQENFKEQEIIYLVSSTGGGSGSSISPILAQFLLSSNGWDKKIGFVGALPYYSDGTIMMKNTIRYFNEIQDIAKIPQFKQNLASIFILDNEKKINKQDINEEFKNLFIQMLEVTKYDSTFGNIDSNDLLTKLKEFGIAVNFYQYGEFTRYSDLINNFSTSNIYAKIEATNGSHLMFSVPEKNAFIEINNSGEKQNIENTTNNLSDTFGIFEDKSIGYRSEDDIFLLVTGLKFPKQRIDKIYNLQKQQEDAMSQTDLFTSSYTIETKQPNVEPIKDNKVLVENKPKSILDLIKEQRGIR